jgi:epoxyqueuosine reductase QueG
VPLIIGLGSCNATSFNSGIALVPLLQMSNKEFKNTYGHLAGAWRGKKPIQRNAILALAHFNETSAIPEMTISIFKFFITHLQ